MTSPVAAPGGGEFRLDTVQARAAITELRKVYDGLGELRRQAFTLARQPRTADDLVSAEAFELLTLKASGGPGSFENAMIGAMERVEALISQMEADIARQEDVDAQAAGDIARS